MLPELHTTLQRLLYERGQINPQEVDIRFEAPTQEHINRQLQPTINLFLFEVQENTELRQNAHQSVRTDGRAERRLPPKRFDLRFMVSALSTEIEDEHLLLWRTLTTLVRYPQIPDEFVPELARPLKLPLVTQICQGEDSQRLLNLWNALGTQPHPALAYTVTVPVELTTTIEAPLVLTRVARYARISGEPASETGRLIGGTVRAQNGETLAGVRVSLEGRASESITNAEGRFVLGNIPAGPITLRVIPPTGNPRSITIASPVPQSAQASERGTLSYEIVL